MGGGGVEDGKATAWSQLQDLANAQVGQVLAISHSLLPTRFP